MGIPDFVLGLREHVGTGMLWLTGVTAVILRDEPSPAVLLVRRADTGAWSPVTGIIDPGETAANAARREALEETGVVIEVERLVRVRTLPPTQYANGDRSQYLDHVFLARWISGTAHVADDESLEVGWFSPTALPPLTRDDAERIERALADDPVCSFD